MNNNSRTFRKGSLGLPQIMATLLVVLPTLVFSIVILLDYWNVMQADYKLKLVANMTSDFMVARADLRDFTDGSDGNATDFQRYLERVNTLCPNQTSATFSSISDAQKLGEIAITTTYDYNGTYIKNKTLTTQMNTYSYADQNISVVVKCQ
ncbi:hypothetical protein [Sulfurimonas sp. C5]|uniref:hypothetical protein n=1 Tax=Sulfurimonas sp. C5 TaxID=3036947 RepID=UPI00245550ED|nr:hypothetical protein [Sulfurimonas sp. C5]MDH4944308.1 hypothetical protein [Sulfurimonas sp. C5]